MYLTKIPLNNWVDMAVEWLQTNLKPLFALITGIIEPTVQFFQTIFDTAPPLVVALVIAFLAFLASRLSIALFTFLGLLLIDNLGYWSESAESIALVLTATIISIVIGIPMGIWSARSQRVQNVLNPILDFMQTMPAFVYLIPAVFFFSLGSVPGVIASVIFSMPPTIRLTNLGIRQVAEDLIEAADAFGSSPRQKLIKVQLPLARPTILAGINQTIMLSLSMVVISSMIGAGGLGAIVLQSISRLEVGKGFEGGVAIVIIAIILDRITQNMGKQKSATRVSQNQNFLGRWGKPITALVAVAVLIIFGLYKQAVPGGGGKKITIASGNWESEVASSSVIKKVLENQGYKVELKLVDAGPMWSGVASGNADVMFAWLPLTGKAYYDRYKNQVDNLGPNLKGAHIGLVVPQYVKANTIDDLKKDKSQFDNEIIGIDSGAGVMQATERALKSYDLGMKLVEGSDAAMTASLKKAINAKKPIVVTGWVPHWKFIQYKLKFLKDPKKVYGGTEHINTMVSKDLKGRNPKAYKILDQFYWTVNNMQQVMLKIHKGEEPEQAAAEWVKENPETVKKWTK
ncbi:glycine betaine/proline transport system substrate-binding protein [Marininema mesophilum]|uniref:Glycine betaine/proline transport system substrate-binding protein n=1 Tax=Marininema mesophilum TaxID=1048340 RepID=A0A1H2QL34_9BACL|nr:ABC transporter permease/substrate binding protein [Marininema mesophilum]SDW07917.1 glycine betaine/proline transport system substrate-binding protein [Marininema mesophilum]